VVSSHGKESKEMNSSEIRHTIYLANGKIFTDDLTAKFNDDNCKELQGKPRLFFIQVFPVS